MKTAHLEPLTSILRVYDDGQQFENRDPYLWSAVVRFTDGGRVAEICGMDKPITPAMWRACVRLAKEIGVEKFTFERVCGSKPGTRDKGVA